MNLDQISATRRNATADAPVVHQPAVAASATKSNATAVEATDTLATKAATIHRQFQLPVRVGGWSGFHDYLVLPQLASRAEAAGVEITLEVAEKHWWKGTLYNVNVEGAADNVERFIAITLRDPVVLA